MSIAAKRSFSLYGLEGPNPNCLMVYEGVQLRSGGGRLRSTEIATVFGTFFGRLMDLEAQTLSKLRYVYALLIYIGFGSSFY